MWEPKADGPCAPPGLSLGDVPNRQPIGIVLTVLGVVVLDFSADATEGPIRAYLLDVVDSEEQDMALNIHAFSAGESAPHPQQGWRGCAQGQRPRSGWASTPCLPLHLRCPQLGPSDCGQGCGCRAGQLASVLLVPCRRAGFASEGNAPFLSLGRLVLGESRGATCFLAWQSSAPTFLTKQESVRSEFQTQGQLEFLIGPFLPFSWSPFQK